MTATINPPAGAHALARLDVAARIEDYRKALSHNLSLLRRNLFDRLVLVDNSGFGTGDLDDIAAGFEQPERVELYSYDGNRAIESRSRLYGECRLIQHALQATRTFALGSVEQVWKITGRYIVRNIDAIVQNAPAGFDMCVQCRSLPRRFVDFGLVGFGRQRAAEVLEVIATARAVDHLDESDLYSMIEKKAFGDLRIVPRLPRVPDFAGIRGYDNQSYDGMGYRMKFLARSWANRLAPGLWL